jgi:hypothetical protein
MFVSLSDENCEPGAMRREARTMGIDYPEANPAHYKSGGIEAIDYIRAKLTPAQFEGYLRGNILKYLSRAGSKGEALQDYAKAAWYSRMLAGDDPRK